MIVTKDDFMDYEGVRVSGVTNMCAINTVSDLSGLDIEVIKEIMTDYGELAKKYLKGE